MLSIGFFLIAGCTQPLNDRTTLGGSYRSPTFRSHATTLPNLQPQTSLLFTSPPKPRTSWTPTQYISPLDGVAHSPTYILFANPTREDLPRIYGRFPTGVDALALPPDHPVVWVNDLLITIQELGRSFIGTPYALGYFVSTGQFTGPIESPNKSWKRTESKNRWSSGYPTPIEIAENRIPDNNENKEQLDE